MFPPFRVSRIGLFLNSLVKNLVIFLLYSEHRYVKLFQASKSNCYYCLSLKFNHTKFWTPDSWLVIPQSNWYWKLYTTWLCHFDYLSASGWGCVGGGKQCSSKTTSWSVCGYFCNQGILLTLQSSFVLFYSFALIWLPVWIGFWMSQMTIFGKLDGFT